MATAEKNASGGDWHISLWVADAKVRVGAGARERERVCVSVCV
jgi:hypothetical protein